MNFPISKKPKMILADLDGTIAESKVPLDVEMTKIIASILKDMKFAVISGGKFDRFEKQVIEPMLGYKKFFENLLLFPTMGGMLKVWKNNEWVTIYEKTIPKEEREFIKEKIKESFLEAGLIMPEKIYGEQIEERASQVTFSALGQEAPISEKEKWDPNQEKRKQMIKILSKTIPNKFFVSMGGSNSIDVNPVGIDKGFAVIQASKYTGFDLKDLLFLGDKKLIRYCLG
jgi:HAD superfamily hydrolase (TIGR01484 family)